MSAVDDIYRFSIAPMVDCTDRHFRFFFRNISKCCTQFTEMIHSNAVLRGDIDKLLDFHNCELPLILQLAGDSPTDMANAVKRAENYGYSGYNINAGCPSTKVQKGNFGACLMNTPDRLADIFSQMQSKTKKPVSIKHRLGVDNNNTLEFAHNFIATMRLAGCRIFYVHARIALLHGLNPKQNRSVPPLRYSDVYQLKRNFPDCKIIINGGIQTLDQAQTHLEYVDGVMLGRAPYENPYAFANIDSSIFNKPDPNHSREQIAKNMIPYIETMLKRGVPAQSILRHMQGLFSGQFGAKHWRIAISETSGRQLAPCDVINIALAKTRK